MNIIQTIGVKCTGCSACMNVCPQDAISMIIGADGFYRPKINAETCISCGKCDRICLQLCNRCHINSSKPICYALAAPDEIRIKSSSGGAFPLLAECILQDGGKVYGCTYGKGKKPEYMGVSTSEMLPELYRSQCAESYIGYVYREVESDLKEGHSVLFCGTPCYIAALTAYLNKAYEKLYSLEIPCNASSAGVFLEYLEELQARFGKKIVLFELQNKTIEWAPTGKSTAIIFEDGDRLNLKDDLYYAGVLRNLFRRDACDTCNCDALFRQGDLTIRDCGKKNGISLAWDDGKGVSLILVNTKKGEMLLKHIAQTCKKMEQIDYDMVPYPRFLHTPATAMEKTMKAHFFALREKYSVGEAIKRALDQLYDIGLVGDWSVTNYGAELTYYALYQFLTNEGYDVLMIERVDWENKRGDFIQTPRLFVNNPYPSYALAAPLYRDIASMKELNDKCDTFLLGSDQLWNKEHFSDHIVGEFLLAFAHTGKRKIAYASSFGQPTLKWPENYIAQMRFLFQRLHKISVREESGVDICQKYFGVHAEHVLDPVFLCDRSYYQALAKKSSVDCRVPYVFCYIVIQSEQKRATIERWAKRLGKRVICVFTYFSGKEEWTLDGVDYLNCDPENCSIEDWLCYMEHSDMVLTDSFHGYCFALIYNKQVLPLFEDSGVWDRHAPLERLRSIAALFAIKEPESIESINKSDAAERYHIDYSTVNKRMKQEQARCKRWLLEALQTEVPSGYDRLDLLWDAFGTEILNHEGEVRRLKQENNRLKCMGKDIVIFGAGKALGYSYDALTSANITVKCVADNDPNTWGKRLPYGEGLACVNPNELNNVKSPFVVISIWDKEVVQEIKTQLNEMGIRDVIHVSELF